MANNTIIILQQVSPDPSDGGCRMHFVDVSLSGSPTLMSGLAMICIIHKHNILLDIHRKERL
jgi:hypothetical protein